MDQLPDNVYLELIECYNMFNLYYFNNSGYLNWYKVQILCGKLYGNPFFFTQINELLGFIVFIVANDVIKYNGISAGCPIEVAKFTAKTMLGLPKYLDDSKFDTLVKKYSLRDVFCYCNTDNCIFKSPTPSPSDFENYTNNNYY